MFVLVLYSYTLIYKFIIRNKHEVLGSKAEMAEVSYFRLHSTPTNSIPTPKVFLISYSDSTSSPNFSKFGKSMQ